MRISIEGLIGSGKTTVCKELFPEFVIIEENIPGWTPYLNEFYSNPKQGSFTLQMKVLLDLCSIPDHTICERSPLTAKCIFTKFHRMKEYMTKTQFDVYNQYYNRFGWQPDFIIYIKTDPIICLQRIQQRNRKCEVNITLEDLRLLEQLEKDLFLNISIPIYTINGNQEISKVKEDVRNVLTGLRRK